MTGQKMDRADLRKELEPLVIPLLKSGEKPGVDVAKIGRRWMDNCGMDIESAMDAFNDVMDEIVVENDLPGKEKLPRRDLSGFVTIDGKETWIGCGSEYVLGCVFEMMVDDMESDDLEPPTNLVTRPATEAELYQYRAESGFCDKD